MRHAAGASVAGPCARRPPAPSGRRLRAGRSPRSPDCCPGSVRDTAARQGSGSTDGHEVEVTRPAELFSSENRTDPIPSAGRGPAALLLAAFVTAGCSTGGLAAGTLRQLPADPKAQSVEVLSNWSIGWDRPIQGWCGGAVFSSNGRRLFTAHAWRGNGTFIMVWDTATSTLRAAL